MPRRTKTNELTETQLPINPSRIEDIDFAMFKYLDEILDKLTIKMKSFLNCFFKSYSKAKGSNQEPVNQLRNFHIFSFLIVIIHILTIS